MQSAHDLPLAQLLHAARALETRWRCSIEQECAHRTGPPNSMPCMALAKLTMRRIPRRTKSKVETFLISSGENHRLMAATHVEIRAVAVAVLAPAHCHAAPWSLATRQRLHGYVCWSPQKKCSCPRNAHQSGSTARRPHTTFWWAWNPGCNFLRHEGAACHQAQTWPQHGFPPTLQTSGPGTAHKPQVPHPRQGLWKALLLSCARHHTPYAWPAAGEVVVYASGGAASRALAYAWPGRREQARLFHRHENAFPSRKSGWPLKNGSICGQPFLLAKKMNHM